MLAVDKEEREIRMTVEMIEEDGTRVTILDASNGTMYHTSQNIVLFGLGLQSVEEISQLFPLKCCTVVVGDLEYFVFPHGFLFFPSQSFIRYLTKVSGFLRVLRFPPPEN